MLRASTAWPSRVRVRHSDLCEFIIITIIYLFGKDSYDGLFDQKNQKSKIPYMAQAWGCVGFLPVQVTLCAWRRFRDGGREALRGIGFDAVFIAADVDADSSVLCSKRADCGCSRGDPPK